MLNDPPAIRILPMSHKTPGFHNRSIENVQSTLFLTDLPKYKGHYHYRSSGLNAPPRTLLLFQYRARIIASATFLYDEKFDKPIRGHAGILHLDPTSIRTFTPLDKETMQKIWPAFRAFGHVKQHLNPTKYPLLKQHLKKLTTPK